MLLAPAGSAEAPAVFVNDREQTWPSFSERAAFLGLATSTATNFQALALADFAGSGGTPDGDLDLYLGRAASSQAFFYQNARDGIDTPTSKWLKVKVASDDRPNNRRETQAAHEFVFGLADAEGDVVVTVTWPHGSSTSDSLVRGRTSVEPQVEQHCYLAAIDAAFEGDRFTFCVAHRDLDEDVVVIDLLLDW